MKDVTYQEDDQFFFILFKPNKSKYFQETPNELDYDKNIFLQNKSDSYHGLTTTDESAAQRNTPPSTHVINTELSYTEETGNKSLKSIIFPSSF